MTQPARNLFAVPTRPLCYLSLGFSVALMALTLETSSQSLVPTPLRNVHDGILWGSWVTVLIIQVVLLILVISRLVGVDGSRSE